MNVQELRYVVAVAQAGSINKAALNLYVSQSTLSRAVCLVDWCVTMEFCITLPY